MKTKRTLALLLVLVFTVTGILPAFSANAAENNGAGPDKITVDLSAGGSIGYFSNAYNIVCTFNASEGSMMLATTGGADPQVVLNIGGVSADIYKYVAITYRMPKSNSGASGATQFFFMAGGQGASAGNMMTYAFDRSYTYKTEIIDLSGKSFWHGSVSGIRIDPFELGNVSAWDTMYINAVTFYKNAADAQSDVPALNSKADGVVADIENFEAKAADTGYNTEVYTEPLWKGNVTYHESVLPLLNPNGTMSPISMVYDIDRIVSVRNSYHNIEYKYGRDYTVLNGKLVINTKAQGGQINTIPYINVYSDTPLNSHYYYSSVLNKYLFCMDFQYQKSQIVVTYTHTSPYKLYVPQSKTATLSRAVEKLQNKEPMNIVFCGDSVTWGHNSSWLMNVPPYSPRWSQMSVDALAQIYDNPNLTHINTAVGGTKSDWGLATVYDNVIRYAPDLCILAWGGNDGAGDVPASVYYQNMKGAVEAVRNNCPDCDIIIVAPLIMNPELEGQKNPAFIQYLDALWDIAMYNEHVAVVDFTSFHRSLHTVKRHIDITENNINHINDFTSRMYAQSIIAALTGTQTEETGTPNVHVSADAVYASNATTRLTPNGGNNPADTYIGKVSDSSIYARGWAACSQRIKSFGYRYGDEVVLNTAKSPSEFAVTMAGDPISGYTGSTARFVINIPINTEYNEVYAVAELANGNTVDLWKITYDTPEKPKPVEFRYMVSADQIWASNGVTDLAKRGGNDTSGTKINVGGTDSIIAYGWMASTVKIVSFGYRYSDMAVYNSPLCATESPVIAAGAPIAGATGSTSRFRVSIPLDKNKGEVWVTAKLADGKAIDLWKITYDPVKPVDPVVPDDPDEPDEPTPIAFNSKVSADEIWAGDGRTGLAKRGGNDTSGTKINVTGTDKIYAFGWFASSIKIASFGYRYGDSKVTNSPLYTTDAAVIAAGAPIAGTTGSTSRFRVEIPLDKTQGEVWVTAKLTDGQVVDLWKITYDPVKPVDPVVPDDPDEDDDTELLGMSFNTVILGNTTLCDTVDAAAWLAQHPISMQKGSYSNLTLRGWAYLSKPISGFGYSIDSKAIVKDYFIETRNDVKAVIDRAAEGYKIPVKIDNLAKGTHKIVLYAFTADGVEMDFQTVTINVTDAGTETVILGRSADTVMLDGAVICNNGKVEEWVKANPIVFAKGRCSTVTFRGWSNLNRAIRSYGYKIDGGNVVSGTQFIESRPDVKAVIGQNAEGYRVTANITNLAKGTHTFEVVAIPASGDAVTVCTTSFTVG